MNKNQKKVLSLSLAVLLGTTSPMVLAMRPALAQETQPGDACSNAGWTRWVSTPTAGLLVCDGANWKSVMALQNDGQSLLQVDNDTGSCTADKTGRLRFDGSSTWDYCDGTTWQGLLSGASGLWSDDTTHISYQSAHIIKSGQTLPAALDDDGIRMFFYPDKAAFRGGTISGGVNAWQEANIGANSFAWGRNNWSSGSYSVSLGFGSIASGNHSVAMGDGSTASGSRSLAMGWGAAASGNYSVAFGGSISSGKHAIATGYSEATGYSATALGGYAYATARQTFATQAGIASGRYSVALGAWPIASGVNSIALGDSATTTGRYSFAFGRQVITGDGIFVGGNPKQGSVDDSIGAYSFAFGVQSANHATKPKITGDRSAVFFFDGGVLNANSTFDFTDNDKFALVGGEFVLSERQVDGAAAGCIRFESAGNKIEYSDDCTTYTAFSDINGLWTDNTTHISYQSAHIIKSGQTLPAALDDDGTRMFFYPDKAAFRGGTIQWSSAAWQDANIGTNSFAWGRDNEASGIHSVAIGDDNTATGSRNGALGYSNTASGSFGSFAIGWGNTASGTRTSVAIGAFNNATDKYTIALGYGNTVSGRYGAALGSDITVSGRYGSAGLGTNLTVSGRYGSVAIGRRVDVGSGTDGDGTGNASIGFGLTTNPDWNMVNPKITGNGSAVFFMDNGVFDANENFVFASSHKLAMVGGEFVLSETQVDGAASGCIRFESAGNKIEYSDDCTTYTAFSDISGLWSDDTTHISYQSAHIIKSGQTLPAALDDDGKRMFFYPDKGAFRGGTISGGDTAWQEANVGTGSFAWGLNNKASGSNSVAFGDGNTASGTNALTIGWGNEANSHTSFAIGAFNTVSNRYSIALGYNGTISDRYSTTIGLNQTVSGRGGTAIGGGNTISGDYYNTAIGFGNTISGAYASTTMGQNVMVGSGTAGDGTGTTSMAFGLQTAAQTTDPKITGDRTIAFFFDGGVANANSGVDITASDAFIIHGGKVGIGDDTPDVELDVVGDINYTGVIQDVSDIRVKTDITPLAEQGDMLAQMEKIDTYTFRMKDAVAQYGDEAPYEYGVIAQNVETVFPELVRTDKDEAKTKSVNYVGLIAPLIEAVKKLSSKNRMLEAEVQALKGRTVEPEGKVPKPNRPAPESSDDPCTVGDMALDKVYLYFCTQEDTWKRWPLETW